MRQHTMPQAAAPSSGGLRARRCCRCRKDSSIRSCRASRALRLSLGAGARRPRQLGGQKQRQRQQAKLRQAAAGPAGLEALSCRARPARPRRSSNPRTRGYSQPCQHMQPPWLPGPASRQTAQQVQQQAASGARRPCCCPPAGPPAAWRAAVQRPPWFMAAVLGAAQARGRQGEPLAAALRDRTERRQRWCRHSLGTGAGDPTASLSHMSSRSTTLCSSR